MKSIRSKAISTGLILLALIGCNRSSYITESAGRPKNVIVIIGDGMGLAQLYSAMSVSKRDLNMSRSRFIGISRTQSDDNYTTDSAAGGTALSTGHKTRNGIIGMRSDSTIVHNLIELAHRKGLSGGVVSTSSITHATPASYVTHNISRNNYEEIAKGFLETKPEVFIGGGYNNFARRIDSVDMVKQLVDEGYTVVTSVEELIETDATMLAGLLAPEHLPAISEGRGDMLSYAAIKAIETLNKNDKGFFLMIEASQIDWGAHENNTRYIVEEVLDMDRALGVVLDYAEKIGETLVIVTADHETGGMTLPTGDIDNLSVSASYTTTGHTGIAVPVFAFGPGAVEFTGVYQNTEIFDKIRSLLKL